MLDGDSSRDLSQMEVGLEVGCLSFYLFVNLQVGAQLILLQFKGADMTLAPFREQFSFKFLPKTVMLLGSSC